MRLPTLLLAATLLTSCSMNRMLLTVDTKKKIENAGVELDRVQFYNSSEIVLARQLKKEEVSVAEGKVRIENGRHIEEIIIPANTPGICELHDQKTLRISFETGDGRSVPFIVEKKGGVVVAGSYFRIGAREWVKTGRGKRVGKVDYQGRIFNLVRGADSRLMIDRSMLNRVKRDTRVARGRKL